jgi:hypothetical protein
MNHALNPTERVIRLSIDKYMDPGNPYHRRSLKQLAKRHSVTPTDVVRLTHRGGLLVYQVDRLKRL